MTRVPHPRCPTCGWHLEFFPSLGFWLARCWNNGCERGKNRVPLTPSEAGLQPIFFRREEAK